MSKWIDLINRFNPNEDDLCDLLDEAEKVGREDAIDLFDRHLWNYSHEVWEDFKPILEELKRNSK